MDAMHLLPPVNKALSKASAEECRDSLTVYRVATASVLESAPCRHNSLHPPHLHPKSQP